LSLFIAGKLWGVCSSGTYSICCGIPTNSCYWSSRTAREDYDDKEGFYYIRPGYLRACWWLDRSCTCYHLCPSWRYYCVVTTGLSTFLVVQCNHVLYIIGTLTVTSYLPVHHYYYVVYDKFSNIFLGAGFFSMFFCWCYLCCFWVPFPMHWLCE
jgi:hypothetical protein